jgi:hypothetical protein
MTDNAGQVRARTVTGFALAAAIAASGLAGCDAAASDARRTKATTNAADTPVREATDRDVCETPADVRVPGAARSQFGPDLIATAYTAR